MKFKEFLMIKKVHWFNSPDLALFLKDPLQEITRKERKALLWVSTLGIIIAHTGLVPTQITALGLVFTAKKQTAWYVILSLINLYFLISFSLYCAVDYVAWRSAARADLFGKAYKQISDQSVSARSLHSGAAAHAAADRVGDLYHVPYGLESQIWRVRCAFEMLLPILLGVYATFILAYKGATLEVVSCLD
jgi:hypothetical protein